MSSEKEDRLEQEGRKNEAFSVKSFNLALEQGGDSFSSIKSFGICGCCLR